MLDVLHPPQTIYAYLIGDDTGSTVDVSVSNLLNYPVVLHEIRIGDQVLDVLPEWISGDKVELLHQEAEPAVVMRRAWEAMPRYITVCIPTTQIEPMLPAGTKLYSNTLQLVTGLYGMDDRVVVDVRRNYPPVLSASILPVQPTVEEALARYPFLALSDQSGFLELKPGTWHVEGDLILPQEFGLWATQPVTLTFDREAIFFSNAPLLLQGPDKGSIYFGPKDDYWAGMIVLKAGADLASVLHNVDIRGTAGISRDGWMTTGGVTFYESPVVMSDCRLLDSIAEDAINIVRSKFELVHSEFGHTASDAFDGDFVEGRIEQCAFHDVRGDGIDVSGSRITGQDVNLMRIYDKGISAGEGSVVNVNGVRAVDVGIVIASKDMSHVIAQEVYITRAWIAGLAAFLKKMEYGPASIQATHVVFEDESLRALVQRGSDVTINGEAIRATELDVDELYSRIEELATIRPLDYRFGPAIRLLDYNLATPSLNPGGELHLVLYWQADAKLEQNYTVFVHILNATGELVAQYDTMPRDDAFPTTHWTVGPLIDDVHIVSLPADIPAGTYQVEIGLYTWQTGERLPLYWSNGEEISGSALILDQTLEVTP
jgi:hypothetical protein